MRLYLKVISFLLLLIISLSQSTPDVYANHNYQARDGNDCRAPLAGFPPVDTAERNAWQNQHCAQGLICVTNNDTGSPDQTTFTGTCTEPPQDLTCTCQNQSGQSSGIGKNGFTCKNAAGQVVPANTFPNNPAAYCRAEGEACINAPGATFDPTYGGGNGTPPNPYGNATLKGVRCEASVVANCHCLNEGVDGRFICEKPGESREATCANSALGESALCKRADGEELLGFAGLFAVIDINSTSLQGVKCEKPVANCTCDEDGRKGFEKNGFTCTRGANETTRGFCSDPDFACTNDPQGTANRPFVFDERNVFPGWDLKGINCSRAGNGNEELDPPPLPPVPPPPCAPGKLVKNNSVCTGFLTAFGEIATDTGSFIKNIFALLLSMSGGIALLLIIRAGYIIMTSSGKPERVQEGRDQLVASIVGLLFIIFSFVILQVIGVEILRIPGFS